MLMRYWHNPHTDVLKREDRMDPPWTEVSPEQAAALAKDRPGWFVMPIHEIDRNAISGIGWNAFVWQPTPEQRRQATVNHAGRTLEQLAEQGGLRWEEIWAVLICNPWRRLVVMRAFSMCRDWPYSEV